MTAKHRSLRAVLLGSALLVTLIVAAAGLNVLTATVSGPVSTDQPGIKFSHKFHVKDNGIACTDCHTNVAGSAKATDNLRPNHTNCESCHQEQLEKTCTFCHVSDDPLTYVAKPSPVRELVFSHEFHVGKQNVACETCHAGIDGSEEAVGEHVPAMASCNTCHNSVTAPNGCEFCHTNLASLRPREHNRTDWPREHKLFAQKLDANCVSCHTQESCQDCHNGTALTRVNVPGTDKQTPNGPRLFAISRGQNQGLLKVHDLNFRYTHGLAAKGKTKDCQTCHEQQEFCSSCHMSGGNVNQDEFKPASHASAGFVMLGVGSGGGLHATLARRDIENCAACHDESGADPTCITCHTDPDGVQGNNPRTHARGFRADDHGPWHTDPGANCFMCHTDPNARPGGIPGQKFCGYCHH